MKPRRPLSVRIVRRCAPLIAVCIAAAAAATIAVSATSAAPARAFGKGKRTQPAHLLVYAQEWSLWPSRPSVPAGKVAVQLWNRGQDQHDLRIRKLGANGEMTGPVLGRVKITNPGATSQAMWHLTKPGKYELYCSLPGHLMMGMHARLTVTKPRG